MPFSYIIMLNQSLAIRAQHCSVEKQGSDHGEATMFQEDWVHGKTGACGFPQPNSARAEGFFTAVGTEVDRFIF